MPVTAQDFLIVCERFDPDAANSYWAQEKIVPLFDALLSQARQEASDAAYTERNQVVAALAKCFPSVVTKTAIEGWDTAWHNCVYVTLPTGQASWHFHDKDANLFRDIPRGEAKWDGHTTPEKYARLDALKFNQDRREALKEMDELHIRFRNNEIEALETETSLDVTPANEILKLRQEYQQTN